MILHLQGRPPGRHTVTTSSICAGGLPGHTAYHQVQGPEYDGGSRGQEAPLLVMQAVGHFSRSSPQTTKISNTAAAATTAETTTTITATTTAILTTTVVTTATTTESGKKKQSLGTTSTKKRGGPRLSEKGRNPNLPKIKHHQ